MALKMGPCVYMGYIFISALTRHPYILKGYQGGISWIIRQKDGIPENHVAPGIVFCRDKGLAY